LESKERCESEVEVVSLGCILLLWLLLLLHWEACVELLLLLLLLGEPTKALVTTAETLVRIHLLLTSSGHEAALHLLILLRHALAHVGERIVAWEVVV